MNPLQNVHSFLFLSVKYSAFNRDMHFCLILCYVLFDYYCIFLFLRFSNLSFSEVEMDPQRAWCPRVGCDTVCKLEEVDQAENHGNGSKAKKQGLPKGKRFICSKVSRNFIFNGCIFPLRINNGVEFRFEFYRSIFPGP